MAFFRVIPLSLLSLRDPSLQDTDDHFQRYRKSWSGAEAGPPAHYF